MAPIPRIIHQIWFKVGNGSSTPPKEYDEMRASWRTLHSNYEFMDWDLPKSQAFIKEHYPDYIEMFNAYKRTIFQIDAIRYFVLHYYGGFYIDTDVTCYRSIEELRQHPVVLALNKYTKNSLPVHNNHFMGAVPRSHFFEECITRLPVSALLQTEKESCISTFIVAGPFYLTTIASYYKKRWSDIYVLPFKTELDFFKHHEKHSWKLSRSIIGDIIRVAVVTGTVAAGAYAVKKIIER